MMAKLTAWLGLDGKNFNAGVDGAKRKVKSLDAQLSSMRKIGGKALAFVGIGASLSAVRSLVNYAKELKESAGISLIDEQSLDSASNTLEGLKASIASLGSFVAEKAGGFFSFFSGGAGFEELGANIERAKTANAQQQQNAKQAEDLRQAKKDYAEDRWLKKLREESGNERFIAELQAMIGHLNTATFDGAKKAFEYQKMIDDAKDEMLKKEKQAADDQIKKSEQADKKKKELEQGTQDKIIEIQKKEFSGRFQNVDELTKMGGGMRFDPRLIVKEKELSVLEEMREIQAETLIEIERISRGED